jgi:hypothetical protein
MLLIEQLGLEGYGIFWILVEMLRDQPEHKYPLILLPAIARKFNSTAEKVSVVVKNYQLFTIENDEFFYSESLNERMRISDEKRNKKSIAGKIGNAKRWENQRLIAEVSQCDRGTSQSKVKESKVKERKVKEIKDIYGNFNNVKLTKNQYSNFLLELDLDKTKKVIDFLSAYKVEKNYKTQDDNLTIRRWVIKAVEEKESKKDKSSVDHAIAWVEGRK